MLSFTKEELKEFVVFTLVDRFTDCEVTEDSKLKKDLDLDSLDIVELTMEVEKKYFLSIPDEVLEFNLDNQMELTVKSFIESIYNSANE